MSVPQGSPAYDEFRRYQEVGVDRMVLYPEFGTPMENSSPLSLNTRRSPGRRPARLRRSRTTGQRLHG